MTTPFFPPRRSALRDAVALERALGLVLWVALGFVLIGT